MIARSHRTPRIAHVAVLAAGAVLFSAVGCVAPAEGPGLAGPEGRLDALAVSRLRERALVLLNEATTSPEPQLRANALEALSMVPSRLERVVGPALNDQNEGVRAVAATVIGRSGLCELALAVRPLLTDASPFVRASAIYTLRRCGHESDPTPLAGLLLNDPVYRVRSHAAFVLGEMGDSSALPLLRQAARGAMSAGYNAQARLLYLQIAEAMVKLGDESQLQTIRAALYPSRPEELEATALAVQIIGELRDEAAAAQLVQLTKAENEVGQSMPAEVRLGAAASLARLGYPEGAFIADEYWQHKSAPLRSQAAYVYGRTGHPASLAKLEQMLEDPDGAVRVAAAAAIVRITGRRGDRNG